MRFQIKDNINLQRKLLQLVIITLIGSALCALLGGLFLIVTIPFLATMICLEFSSSGKVFSIVSCALNLIVTFVLGGYYFVFGLASVLCAFVLAFYIINQREKSECVAICTFIISLAILSSFALEAIAVSGASSLQGIIDYYSSVFSGAKSAFLDAFELQISSMPYDVDEAKAILDSMSVMFDSIMYSALSFIVIFAFAVCGFSMKVFSVLMHRNSKNGMTVLRWRFSLSSVIAYAASIIIVLSFFASGSTDLFSLTVVNLYNIFSVIFYELSNYIVTIVNLNYII